jgi:hypothetical protein
MLTLLPQMASAQCPEGERTRALLEKTPTGHYAQKVIERVDNGLTAARNLPSNPLIFDMFKMHWLINIESIMYMLLDTEIQSVEYSRDLTKISACLHADLAILEAKMEEVRCEIKKAHLNKSPGGIGRLESIALFLNSRYKHLVQGALNTKHIDPIWQYHHAFDEPFGGWCCVAGPNECRPMTSSECGKEENNPVGGSEFYPTRNDCLNNDVCISASGPDNAPPEYEPICPFDSNYLAPTFSGYGCDLTVLNEFNDLDDTSLQEEYNALDALVTVRDEFLDDTDHIRESAIKMDSILGETMLSDAERQHLEQFGEADVRNIEHKHAFGCEADVPPEGDEDSDGDNDPADKIKPSRLWATQEVRGPFFFVEDHLNIWKEFFRLNLWWAGLREYPDYLKKPSEFFEEADREKAMSLNSLLVPRNHLRTRWASFMQSQATQEAVILPKAQDMQQGVADAMQPLRVAMRGNIELVKDSSGGLRKFAKGYAYFLRRSCINRQCNSQLETILKILFSDECFPYASGEFETGNDEDNASGSQTWKDCKEAVENL